MDIQNRLISPGPNVPQGDNGAAQDGADKAGSSLKAQRDSKEPPPKDELQERFTEFVGQTLFGSMLASMRKSLEKPAYMHGGRTEEVFQQQLDQLMVEELTESSAGTIAEPMFDLFSLQRKP